MGAAIKINRDRLATVKDACEYGGWSRKKLYRLINTGKIAAFRDVGRTLVDLDSIDAYWRSLPRVGPGGK